MGPPSQAGGGAYSAKARWVQSSIIAATGRSERQLEGLTSRVGTVNRAASPGAARRAARRAARGMLPLLVIRATRPGAQG